MSNEFIREERYVVFKISDVVEHLTTTDALHLAILHEIQRVGRKEAGKPELECVVVESDWPEYEPTWQAIEARVTGAQTQLNEIRTALQRALELGQRETWTGARKHRSWEDQREEQQCWNKVWSLLGTQGEEK